MVAIASGGSATFNSANAGTPTATGSFLTLQGTDAANYTLTAPPPPRRSRKAITIAANDQSQTYGFGGTSAAPAQPHRHDLWQRHHFGDAEHQRHHQHLGQLQRRHLDHHALERQRHGRGHLPRITYTPNSGTLNIAQKALTDSGFAVNGKTYNASTTAAISSNGSLTNGGTTSGDGKYLTNDVVSIASGGSASFGLANAGTETATGSLTLQGTDAANYTLTAPTASATIAQLAEVLSGSRRYDGTTNADASILTITNNLDGTSLTLSGTGTLADSAVGSQAFASANTLALGGSAAGNYTLSGITTNASAVTIVPAVLAITLSGTKVYDGTTDAPASILTITNLVLGDILNLSGTGVLASKDVGSQSLTSTGGVLTGLSLSGLNAADYTLVGASGSVTITTKNLTVNGLTAGNKTYDATTAANLNTGSASLVGVVSGDTVSLNAGSASGNFASKNVGNSITVTVSGLTLNNNGAGDYTLTQPTTTADISAELITITAANQNQTYGFGGTSGALGTSFNNTGTIYNSDITGVTLSTNATSSTSNNYNAGTWTITPSSASGSGVANYSITYTPNSGTLNIAQKALTDSGFAVNGKTYNASTTASISSNGSLTNGGTTSGDGKYLTNDVVSIASGGSAGFGLANAGTETATGSLTLQGTDAADYTLTAPTASATIAQEAITITAANQNQTYGFGGTSGALGTGFNNTGTIYNSDITGVTLSTNATSSTSNNYNAGTWTITPSSASGSGVANYSITYTPNSGTLNIAQKALTDSGFAVNGKTYNASTTASISSNGSLTNGGTTSGDGKYLTNDVVSIASGGSAGFGLANAGTETATGSLTLQGTDAADYTLTAPTASATIAQEAITITAANQNQTYGFGGTSGALGTGFNHTGTIYNSDITGVTLSTNATSSTSNNYNAGTWTITPSSASGSGVANYSITYTPNSGSLVIAQKALTDSGFAVNGKTYNASTTASISSNGSLTNGGTTSGDGKYLTNDVVSIASGGSASFGSASAGSQTATGSLTLQGTDAANYTLTAPTASATIAQEAITITAANQNQSYGFGGTSGALGTGFNSSGTIYNSDITGVTLSTNATSSTSNNYNAGTWTITPSSASGSGVANYSITYTPNSGTLNIAQKALTDSGFAVNGKTYNASTTATISSNGSLTNGGTTSGDGKYLTNDVVSIASGGSASFGSANAGSQTATGSLTLQGTDAADYTLTAPTASATIAQEAITITAANQNQSYGFGGTSGALGTGFNNTGTIYNSDITGVTLSTNATSSTSNNYNAGTWTITPSSASGSGVANYSITYTPNSGTLDIAQKALTDSGFAVNGKTYNASTTATISSNGSLTNGGTTSGDGKYLTNDVVSIASGGSASFGSANAGSQTATGSLTLQGTDAADYTLTAPTASATIAQEAITITAANQNQTYGFGGTSGALGTSFNNTGTIYNSDITGVTLSTNATSSTSNNYNAGTWTITPSSASGSGVANYSITYTPNSGTLEHRAEGADGQRLCGEWQDL